MNLTRGTDKADLASGLLKRYQFRQEGSGSKSARYIWARSMAEAAERLGGHLTQSSPEWGKATVGNRVYDLIRTTINPKKYPN